MYLQLTCYFLRPSELPNQTADMSNYTQTAGPTFRHIIDVNKCRLMIFMRLSDFLIMVQVEWYKSKYFVSPDPLAILSIVGVATPD